MTFPPWLPLYVLAVVAIVMFVGWRYPRRFWWVFGASLAVTFVAATIWTFLQ